MSETHETMKMENNKEKRQRKSSRSWLYGKRIKAKWRIRSRRRGQRQQKQRVRGLKCLEAEKGVIIRIVKDKGGVQLQPLKISTLFACCMQNQLPRQFQKIRYPLFDLSLWRIRLPLFFSFSVMDPNKTYFFIATYFRDQGHKYI